MNGIIIMNGKHARAHAHARTHLQQQDEVVHRVVARVQIVSGAQTVVGVKVHLLVDTGVAQQVEQDLLGHSAGAEVLHFCKGGGRWGQRSRQRDATRWHKLYREVCGAVTWDNLRQV